MQTQIRLLLEEQSNQVFTICIIWMYQSVHSMVEPLSLNYRVLTLKFVGVQIFMYFNFLRWATSKKMKQKCDIGGQISNQIDHNKFSIF